jgi:transmembrane sensor
MALNIPWDLLKKYFQHAISDNELQQLMQWRKISELNDTIFQEIEDDKNIRKALISGQWEDNSEEWQQLLSRIKPSQRKIYISRKTLYLITSTAATILLLLGFSLGMFFSHPKFNEKTVQKGYTYIFSPRGQRTKVILPDKTLVWLNAESSIQYPVSYNQKQREVYLSGEAFFEVEKNPGMPFIVNTSELKVKVYGTSFNVKAFPDEKYIETTLIEGTLSIIPMNGHNKESQEIYLKPNEKCVYEKDADKFRTQQIKDKSLSEQGQTPEISAVNPLKSKIIVEENIDTEKEKLWKDGKLIFKNESFDELAVRLGRWYDVKIHFEDEKMKNYKFTGSFEKETINQAMDALQLSSQKSYQYEIIFRDIYLRSN